MINIVASLSWASPADGAGAVGAGTVTDAAGVGAAAGAGADATAVAVGGATVEAGDTEVVEGAGQCGGLEAGKVAVAGVEGTGSSSSVGLVGLASADLASFSSPFI